MTNKQLELYHYGIPGMRWGVRRFQKPDGTLTPKGRKRYAKEEYDRSVKEALSSHSKEDTVSKKLNSDLKKAKQKYKAEIKDIKKDPGYRNGQERAVKVLGLVGTLLVADHLMAQASGEQGLVSIGKDLVKTSLITRGF